MKYTSIIIFYFSFILNSYSQEYHLSVIEADDFNSVVLEDDQGKIEIVAQFAFKVKLLDTKILNKDKVCFIIEAPLHFQYEKFINNNGKWQRSNTSGILGSNNQFSSAPLDQDLGENQRIYKIIDEDLVQIIDSTTNYIKDCLEFRVEREKWIEDCRKSKKH